MNQGAYWAGSPLASTHETPMLTAVESGDAGVIEADERPPVTPVERLLLAAVVVLALAWLGLVGWLAVAASGTAPLGVGAIARGISLASGPLALIAVLVVLWQRNAPREAARYADVARGVRSETLALDAVLSLASRRLADDRAAVADQADRLLALADETSSRLDGVARRLADEIAELGRRSADLDAAAGTARVDMGVLLADLPAAERQVAGLAETLRGAGVDAHEQAVALQATLTLLSQRAREAEEGAAGAANRLSAQVSHIAGATDVATRGIDEAGGRMGTAIDAVLARAAQAMARTRDAVAAQEEALAGLIERGAAATEAATGRAAAALEARVAAIGAEVDALAAALVAQDAAGEALVERIRRGLSAVEARFAELDETGGARTQRLGEALGQLWTHAERTMSTLNDGGTAAITLINRTETLKAAISACIAELGDALPAALDRLEAGAARSGEAIAAATPAAERLAGAADTATAALDAGRRELDLRFEAMDALATLIAARLEEVREQAGSLDDTIGRADTRAEKLADETSPRLVEALIRVRETAGQAATRAREALGAIVPHSAEALGEAGRRALEAAVGDTVRAELARMAEASASAVEAANAAATRLDEQLARVADTSASVDAAIAAGRAEIEAGDRDNFSRRVALLIDSLNSTSIDVAKLLAEEQSDASWAAYLKGDRGIFTRRAVRLLASGEARALQRHYEAEAEFRDQVNRYVHDFEALLRPILSTRDGNTLGVILLSSEMGKLYVALAQAIERLRA